MRCACGRALHRNFRDVEGKVVGSLSEVTLVKLLHDGVDLAASEVSRVMGTPMPQVDEATDISEVYRLLIAGYGGVLVNRSGVPRGLLARMDLADFWAARAGREKVRRVLTRPSMRDSRPTRQPGRPSFRSTRRRRSRRLGSAKNSRTSTRARPIPRAPPSRSASRRWTRGGTAWRSRRGRRPRQP